jgi:hypothetical protein
MIALYLVAKDQTTLETALIDAGVAQYVDQDEALVLSPVEGYSIDTIGFAEGYVGYMCNLLGEFTEEQLAILPAIPFPVAPLRIFWGWDNGEAPKLDGVIDAIV